MFKVNNKDTRTTPVASFWCFIVNFGHISHPSSSVSIVNFKQVNAGWAADSIPLEFPEFLNSCVIEISQRAIGR